MKKLLSIYILILIVMPSAYAQGDSGSYEAVKEKSIKKPIPGVGELKGKVTGPDGKTRVPLAFIDVLELKRIQSDKKGNFALELDEGTYDIKIYSSGFKELLIEDLSIKEGIALYINVSLAEDVQIIKRSD